jgi:MFS family permease
MHIRRSILLFGSVYLCQGGLSAYISFFQKPYLASEGIRPASLGLLTTLVSLPFAIKVLFGLVTDRFALGRFGNRVPWIVTGISISAAAFFVAAYIRPSEQLPVYIALIAGMVFAIAFADTALDGLAVEAVPAPDRAHVQAALIASKALGAVVASAGVGLVMVRLGYAAVMPVMAVVALLPLPFVLTMVPRTVRGPEHKHPPVRQLARLFDRRRLMFIGYALVMAFGLSGTIGLVTLFMRSGLGANASAIGAYGALASTGTLVGAGLYSTWRRWARVETATLTGQALMALLALTLAVQSTITGVTLMGLLVGGVYGFVVTGVRELSMARAEVAFAGTSFALLMALFDIGGSVGDGIATACTGIFGFFGTFVGLAGISVLAIPLLFLVHRLQLANVATTLDGVEASAR